MNIDLYGNLFIALGILLLSAIIVPIFSGNRKLAGLMNFLMVSVAASILLYICYNSIFPAAGKAESHLVSFGFVNIYFLIDAFSGFFIGIISFMAIVSAIYSIEYMEHYPDYKLAGYYLAFPLFILGMLGIVTVDDLSIGFTISWQVMTIASYYLIRFEYKENMNVRNANKYLILMELAWFLITISNLFIEGATVGDSIHTITSKLSMTKGISLYIVYGLLLIGFGFKAGMFPFGQLWLPDAHSIAPSPISALLSGVMIKTGVYGIIRTFFWMVPSGNMFDGSIWGIVISSFGVVTLFIGTVQSMKQDDSKKLLAYSSIGQIGYILFGIGAALFMFYNSSEFVKLLSIITIIGVVYHVLNHAVFKGLLFLTSGSVLYATGTKDLNKLGGLLKIMPVSAIIAGIASLSISGVPPFSGFASKWTIISSSILAGSEVLFLVMFGIIALFTSAITLSCYVKFFGMTYTSVGAEWNIKKEIKEVPAVMLIPKVILSILCVIQGLFPFFYFQTIINIFKNSEGSSFQTYFNSVNLQNNLSMSLTGVEVNVPGIKGITSSLIAPAIVLIIFIIAFIFSWILKKSAKAEESQANTWLCGYQDLNNKNRYLSSNMFAAFKNALWWTGGNVKK